MPDGTIVERYACSDEDVRELMGPSRDTFLHDRFGLNVHVAGEISQGEGCLVVVKSNREDDTSEPLLKAMRKAASQLTSRRPSFIAVQFQDVAPSDLLSVSLRRRMGILSYGLFGQNNGGHINGTYFTGFGASVFQSGLLGTPAFLVKNPKATFPIDTRDAAFLHHVPDIVFAEIIGSPLPAPDISYIPFESEL